MQKPTKAFKQMIKSGKTSKNGFDTRHIHTHGTSMYSKHNRVRGIDVNRCLRRIYFDNNLMKLSR